MGAAEFGAAAEFGGVLLEVGDAGALGADGFDAGCEEFASEEAGVDEVLLHPVAQTAKLKSNVDVNTILVRIETSFLWSVCG